MTRTDQFNYLEWLRGTDELGKADFCVVQVGANDLQSIALGPDSYLAVGTEIWQGVYQSRVEAMLATLKTQRCKETVWLLQPAYEKNDYLRRYNRMINAVQRSALKSASTPAFEINAGKDDYIQDGIHFNAAFVEKLGQAVARVFESCKSNQSWADFSLPASNTEVAAQDLSPRLLHRVTEWGFH